MSDYSIEQLNTRPVLKRVQLKIPHLLPGLNDYISAISSSRFAGNNLKQETEEGIMWEIKRQLRGLKIRSATFHFLWIEEHMKRDKDNIASAKKFFFDAFQKSGLLKNDGWSQVVDFRDYFHVDPKKPRVLVTIEIHELQENQGGLF